MSDAEAQRYGGQRDVSAVLGDEEPIKPEPQWQTGEEAPEPEPRPDPTQAPPAPQPAPEPEKTYHFDPKYREALTGMLYLGRLEDEFHWGGHKFVIRTLTAGEQVEAGILIQPALGTRVEMKAHAASYVAAGLVSVDDVPLIVPLGPNAEPTMRDKYNHLLKNWYAPTLDVIYTRIYRLEIKARELVDALGEAEGQGA